jgi:hypothetical protein
MNRAALGRPEKFIDPDEVEKLASLGCSIDEMAAFFGVSHSTIDARLREPEFRTRYQKGLCGLKMNIRMAQIKRAREGNIAMLIWLGKQLLGQHEPRPQDDDKPQELQQPNQIPEHVMLDTLSRALKPKGYTVIKIDSSAQEPETTHQ